MAMGTCEENIYCAKIAEQAKRYDEMANYMKEVAEAKAALTVEERNLLSVAYKNAVGSLRSALRIARSAHANAKEDSYGQKEKEFASNYRSKIKHKFDDICTTILRLLSEKLKHADGQDAKVFYYKMEGDYYRYRAEFADGDEKVKAVQNAQNAYDSALDALKQPGEDLDVTHPIRLGLALNYSVFQYEVLSKPCDACNTARTAFEKAIAELDDVEEDSHKESTLIMQLLRENLILWTTEYE